MRDVTQPDIIPKSKSAIEQIARTGQLYKLIQKRDWDATIQFLNEHESSAKEWITEHNPDGTIRWKSLPIHLACEKQPPVDVLYNLISGYPESIGEKNYGGDLPLHIACREGVSKDVINFMLLRDPFESTKVQDCEGRLPLHLASRNGVDGSIIKDLLDVNTKSPRTPDDFGLLPLHWACSKNASAEVVELLIEAYPYGIETKDAWGRTPVDLAKTSDNPEKEKIMQLLSQDVSYFAQSMMNTISNLSHRVIENGMKESQIKKLGNENNYLVRENINLKQEIDRLEKEMVRAEEGFQHELELIEEAHKREIEKLKDQHADEKQVLERKNREAEQKISDLRKLVDEVVEKLKLQRSLVQEKESTRKELKDKAVALVKRIQEEKKLVSQMEEENMQLRMREMNLVDEIKRKDVQMNDVRRSLGGAGPIRMTHESYDAPSSLY